VLSEVNEAPRDYYVLPSVDMTFVKLKFAEQNGLALDVYRFETLDFFYTLASRARIANPVEDVWQFLRDNWLSNRVFRGYDDIVAHCCDAWNELMDQPWRIRSIGRRAWADAS
jgi:hypothetical protein